MQLAWARLAQIERWKAGFNPDQPRDDHGRWTDAGGPAPPKRTRLAGEIPTNDTPEVPSERPRTAQERNRIARAATRRLGGRIGLLLEGGSWLAEKAAEIWASLDPPKSLRELQQAALTPAAGYDIHHIVERSAEGEIISRAEIELPENRVGIPRWKHWDINGWYSEKNDEFGGLSPRDYLRRRDWDEHYRIGLKALIRFGVLKP
jgi:hypothetical protein